MNINPLYREEVPRDAQSIQNRINEISFNTSLLRELRAISFVKRLIADEDMPEGKMKDVKVHLVEDAALMTELSIATKMIALPTVLTRLRNAGYAAMERFLGEHKDQIGSEGTVDLAAMFA